jgi:hypothetical protein
MEKVELHKIEYGNFNEESQKSSHGANRSVGLRVKLWTAVLKIPEVKCTILHAR